jgi:Family of unknown function (DUF5686)/CarboxypepD_reg-like domain
MNQTTLIKILLTPLLLCISLLTYSQMTEIRGKIIDAKTKEPMSFANVTLKGTLTSTTCDGDGYFYIRTIERSDSVVVTYLGYPRKAVKILKGKSQQLNIEMGASSFEYKPVVVKAGKRKRYIDTVALYVFHQVVDNKSKNTDENINGYKLEEYAKLNIGLYNPKQKFLNWKILHPFSFAFKNLETITRDTVTSETNDSNTYLRVLLKEDIYDIYYRKTPQRERRVIKGTSFSGIDNNSIGDLVDYAFTKVHIYNEIYVITGKSFLAPFAHGANATYRYFITDTQRIDGRVSYKIHFVGKSKVDLALKGYAWIDSATWGIKDIFFRPNERANINYLEDYTVHQVFSFLPSNQWILSGEQLSTIGGIFKSPKKRMKILVQKSFDRRNIQPDAKIEDSIFARVEDERREPDARDKSREWWDSSRFTPLNKYEREVIRIHDTVKTIPAYRRVIWLSKLFTGAFFQAGPVEFGRFYKFVSRDSAEGLRLRFGGQTNQFFSRRMHFSAYGAIGLRDKDFKYEITSHYLLPAVNDRWSELELSYRYDMVLLGQENPFLSFDNAISLFRSKPLTKLLKVREWRASFENEWLRGYTSIFTLDNKIYYDLPGLFDFKVRRPDGKTREIPTFSTTELVIENRYAYHDKYFKTGFYRFYINTIYPAFTLYSSIGILNLDGRSYPYSKLVATVKHRLPWVLGHTKYQIQVGKIIGSAPYPTAFATAGSQGLIFDPFSFNMLREFEFVTDQYVSLYAEHHFEGYIFNKIPLWNRLQLREILYMRALWGTYSKKNYDMLIPITGLDFYSKQPYPIPYIEAGVGIENILKVIRLDAIWRVTHRDQVFVPNFAVKLSFNFAF